MRKVLLFSCCALIAFSGSLAGAQKSSARRASAVSYPHLPPAVYASMETINPEHIRAHVRYLASDLLEGRGTGQRGGDIAAEYIATQFALFGLKPAGDNGTYMQKVPMVGITPGEATTFSFVSADGAATPLKPLEQYVAYDATQSPESDIDAPIVFVGYGISAPEYNWDDYKGVDVKGKVLRAAFGRSQILQGRRPDLLRALDLQVRRGCPARGGGRHSYPSNRHGQLWLGGGA
jgi:hypothetical protein